MINRSQWTYYKIYLMPRVKNASTRGEASNAFDSGTQTILVNASWLASNSLLQKLDLTIKIFFKSSSTRSFQIFSELQESVLKKVLAFVFFEIYAQKSQVSADLATNLSKKCYFWPKIWPKMTKIWSKLFLDPSVFWHFWKEQARRDRMSSYTSF